MSNLKNTISATTILVLLLLTACSKEQALSSQILNQDNCALMNKEKLKIIDGNIIRLPLKELMGEIFIVDHETIKITDDLNQSKVFKLKKQSKDDKSLLTVWWDENNILFACALR